MHLKKKQNDKLFSKKFLPPFTADFNLYSNKKRICLEDRFNPVRELNEVPRVSRISVNRGDTGLSLKRHMCGMRVRCCIGVYKERKMGRHGIRKEGSKQKKRIRVGRVTASRRLLRSDKFRSVPRGFFVHVGSLRVRYQCVFLFSTIISRNSLKKIMIWQGKSSMRRDHVKQQWRRITIGSVSWTLSFLLLGLYPVLADITLYDMGKCITIYQLRLSL